MITADACAEIGLEVPHLDDSIAHAMDEFLPSYWSRGNPVDMVATISQDAYLKGLELLLSWEKVDAVISLSGGGGGPLSALVPDVRKKAELLIPPETLDGISHQLSAARAQTYQTVCELIEKYKKPILSVGANLVRGKGESHHDFSIPQFRTPERAARAAGMLYQYARYRKAVGRE